MRNTCFFVITLVIFLGWAPKLGAQSGLRPIVVHPFNAGGFNLVESNAFSSLHAQAQDSDFASRLVAWAKSQAPDFDVQVRAASKGSWSFLLDLDPSYSGIYELSFVFKGTDVCSAALKGMMANSGISILGFVPEALELEPEPMPAADEALRALRSLEPLLSRPKIVSNCWLPVGQSLSGVWMIDAVLDELPYRFWVSSSRIHKKMALYFGADNVDAKIQAYEVNSENSELTTFNTKLSGIGTLDNEFFTTDTNSVVSGIERAVSNSHEFIFEPSHPSFPEASVFIHAVQMHDFFRGLGYVWNGAKPLSLRIHRIINGTQNNALYQPFDSGVGNRPSISVGDGDGKILQNLTTDSDVVSHELGHHIIFQYVTETGGESLILHEGLADYFTFAKSGDPCLGESICVDGATTGCTIVGQCLRSADNDLVYRQAEYNVLDAHLKGQIISGFLWDLQKIVDPGTVLRLAYDSLSLLVSNSDISHWLAAMMITDHNTNSGDNSCTVYDTAVARGFESLLSGVVCSSLTTIPLPSNGAAATSTQQTSSSGGRSTRSSCGGSFLAAVDMGKGPPGSGSPWGGTLLILLPLGLAVLVSFRRSTTKGARRS